MNKEVSTYPVDFEQKIGFDKIVATLKSFCVSPLGTSRVALMRPSLNLLEIQKDLDILEEYVNLLINHGASVSESGFYDLREDIRHIKAEGSWWEADQFIDLRSLLRHSYELIRLFQKEETIHLKQLYEKIEFPDQLLKRLEKVFNDKGEVSDNASPELNRLRRSIEQNRQQVRKSIDIIFRNARKDGLVPDGSSISIRDGRMVIPIVAEAKRRLKGFIHDESATGQTVFIEPANVLEGNNRQRELEYEERREVIRILKEVSRDVYVNRDSITQLTEFMAEVDFLRSKRRLSETLKAQKPVLSEKSLLKLHNARHPILLLNNHHVVPLTLSLGQDHRVVLISGPNAGGKSVALKTVALLQYMVQMGLPIPADEGTTTGIFHNIFIDIGDEQSIENDLSTYSSHLRNMKHMLDHVDDRTMLLIDEFGSGTEPHFGGALAEGMLEEFLKAGARGVITTHYANLKGFAEKHDGVVNAAMLFDMEKLKPLYQLSIGKPGSSHALDIAKSSGLSDKIINKAKHILGEETIDYEKALGDLQNQLKKVQEKHDELIKREKAASSAEVEYRKLKDQLEQQQKKLIDKAKTEADAIVAKANKEIEKTIRHIKENRAEKKETKKIRQRLQDFKKNTKPSEEQAQEEIDETPISKGDYVELIDSNVIGQVQSIQGNDVEVMLGDLKTMVKIKRLRKASRKEARRQSSGRNKSIDLTAKVSAFSRTLDIRGKRAEEALSIVDKYIDDAILADAGEVRILHGKGNGVLKDIVRNHLKGFKQVRHMADEHVDHGGAGITVVQLED